MSTKWVHCPGGVFELRFGRRAILHTEGGISPHDYSKEEISCYASFGENLWFWLSEEDARKQIAKLETARPHTP